MLFDYLAAELPPGRAGTVWSQFPLQPLAPGALTPFSYSVLAEIASRAWFVYYDRLGFDPTPRSKVVRCHQGHVYFNLSLCAQLEADHASVEPMPLHLNGQPHALATWAKPGFLAGFKVGRAQKRIDDTLAEMARDMGDTTAKARAWYLKTQGIRRWGQAEVLQIMEEIERMGVESMTALLAARLNLAQRMARLVADLTDPSGSMTVAKATLSINGALGDLSGLVEHEMIDALAPLVAAARTPDQHTWLKNADAATWHSGAGEALRAPAKAFLDAYGHRARGEGEIAHARWAEDASLLYDALLAQIEQPLGARDQAASSDTTTMLNALPAAARKQGEQSLKQMGELVKLQSRALHALAYIWAGTRSWALASAREAMVDQRLHQPDEAFLFELEEIKQMMTGEWNISSRDEIRATVAQRQAEFAAVRNELAPALLIGDTPADSTHQGLPGVPGKAVGPLDLADAAARHERQGAIVAARHLDSGYTLALSNAAGFVAATGTPCDPFVVAAQAWSRPVAVGIGKRYAELGNDDGTSTTLEVNDDGVAISSTPA